jgi:hypothetical protein
MSTNFRSTQPKIPSPWRKRLVQTLAISLSLLVMGWILAASFVHSGRANEAITPPLFTVSQQPAAYSPSLEANIIRSQYVTIDFSQLQSASENGDPGDGSSPPDARLNLNLFPDLALTALLKHSDLNWSGSTTWIGIVEGDPYSHVSLTYRDGMLSGGIAVPTWKDGQRLYFTIRPVSEGVHVVYQVDPAGFQNEAPPTQPEIQPNQSQVEPTFPQAEDGSFIDVMVLYTDDARSDAGSQLAIELLVDTAIQDTNESYANSGITQRLRLVYTGEVTYTEPNNSQTTLECMQTSGDGCLENVLTLRDDYAADIVTLLIKEPTDTGTFGIGYWMQTVSSSFAAWAFNVVDMDCINGPEAFYSYAHELGHNMGAQHDWYNKNNLVPYTYAHGFVPASRNWRTIMAYPSECTAAGTICDRILYWSNPSKTYVAPWITPAPTAAPMGVAGGTNTSCSTGDLNHPLCDADNHRVLNNTAVTVANFRTTKLKTPVYVDLNAASFGAGTSADPYKTIEAGVGLVLPGGIVYISPGTYNSIMFIRRAMTLEAPSGTVTIGP